jgi:hypothetical protein
MINIHEQNTRTTVETVIADTKYGGIENFLYCHDQQIKAHIPPIVDTHSDSGRRKGIFPKESFSYNPDTDTFTCPAGKILTKRMYHKKRKHFEYKASAKDCSQCELRNKCTRAKDGRSLKRHLRQDELDLMISQAKSDKAKKDINYRQHLSERSFAWSNRYGYKRARWRGLWRMEIQDFLIAAIQNISVLISHTNDTISQSIELRCKKAPSSWALGLYILQIMICRLNRIVSQHIISRLQPI